MAKWQFNKRFIGGTKVLAIVAVVALLLYFAPALILQISSAQRWAGRELSSALSIELGTPVKIGRVSLEGWHSIQASDVSIQDQEGRLLLSTETLEGGVDLWALIGGEGIRLTSARLFGLELCLVEDSTGRLNAQHIIDHLQETGSDNASPISLDINIFLLRKAHILYHKYGASPIEVHDLDLQVSRFATTPHLSGIIDELSFRTEAGLRLSDLEASVALRGDTLEIANFEASMPESNISLPLLRLDLGRQGLGLLQSIQIGEISLALDDVTPLYPPLKALSGKRLELWDRGVSVSASELSTEGISLQLENELSFTAHGAIALDRDGNGIQYKLDQVELSVSPLLASLLPQLVPLPSSIADLLPSLGNIRHTGQWRWIPQESLSTTGTLKTALGELSLEAISRFGREDKATTIEGHLDSQGLDLTPLVGRSSSIKGQIDTKLSLSPQTMVPWGSAQMSIDELAIGPDTYQGLNATIEGSPQGLYSLSLQSADPKAMADMTATFAVQNQQVRQIALELHNAEAQIASFTRGKISRLSTQLSLKLSDLDLEQAVGEIDIPRLEIEGKTGQVQLRDIQLKSSQENGSKQLDLSTPWMQATLQGQYRLGQLIGKISQTLQRRVPILRQLPSSGKLALQASTEALLTAQIDSLPTDLINLLGLPLQELKDLQLSSTYRERDESLQLALSGDRAMLLGHRLDSVHLRLEGDSLQVGSNVYFYGGGELIGANLNLVQTGDNLLANIYLGQDKSGTDNGHLGLSATISSLKNKVRTPEDLIAEVKISPSRLKVHTTHWDLAPATITLASDLVRIQGLSLTAPERSITAEGELGRMGLGTMDIDLRQINLRYILEAVGVNFDLLETDLSGHIRAQLMGDRLTAQAHVTSPQLLVSGHDVGHLDTGVIFDSDDMHLRLAGDVYQPHGGKSKVGGWIKLANGAGIDLDFDATELDVSFVGGFMDNIFSHLSGHASGQMRLHGVFEEGVTVSGIADISSGQASIGVLGTTYYFDHRITLSDDRINFNDMQVRDAEGNSGYLNGYITHKYFDNFQINLRGNNIERMKVLQTTSPRDMPVYGTAYASGSAEMRTVGDRMQIQVDLRSELGTDVTLDFLPASAKQDKQLLQFTRLRPDSLMLDTSAIDRDNETPYSGGAIDLILKLAITPEAKLGMKLAADMSSELKGRGEGILNINAPSQGQPEVYGSLSVLDGSFAFRLEQLAQKQFSLREGGQVTFRGNPSMASINLSAVYSLTANIADLDEKLSSMAERTNIPVNCILTLSGNVSHPDIRFGLELPGVDSDMERQVRSLLNSEDAITRQMLYLIALGKFYTETQSSSATNNWTAVASSALSEQLSSLLGNLSNTIKLGTSIKTRNTAFEDTDIELLFSGSWFDNRLTINGNIGYHDTPYLNGEYLGEFDIEYKLNRSGSIRLKGYNRYNNMYQYLRQSLMTQGFGILFRQRFDRLSDLWQGARSSRSKTQYKEREQRPSRDTIPSSKGGSNSLSPTSAQ